MPQKEKSEIKQRKSKAMSKEEKAKLGNNVILRTENLTKKFGELVAVDHVDMEVNPGTFAALFGPNGAGKTTFVNVVTNFLTKTDGRVWFKGKEITNLPASEIYHLGLARSFQIPRVYDRLTVLENTLLGRTVKGENYLNGALRNSWNDFEEDVIREAFEVLEMVGLADRWHERANELSGGNFKLLDLAKSIMTDAEMLLMDEPIAGVDPSFSHVLFERLKNIWKELDLTVLTIEHRLNIALEYMEYAYALHEGDIIAEGDPDEVVENPQVIEGYFGEEYEL